MSSGSASKPTTAMTCCVRIASACMGNKQAGMRGVRIHENGKQCGQRDEAWVQ